MEESDSYLTFPITTTTIHRISKPGKPSKEYFFHPRATNADHDIAHNTKTTDNTGINKYSKYKVLRHTVYQGILQIQE